MNRSFLRELAELRKGALQDELSQKFGELVQQVKQTGRGGSITLTLKVSPLGKDSPMQTVDDDVKLALPKVTKTGTIFYVTDNGDHSLTDPNQPERTLKDVSAPAASVKEVANG